MQSAQLLGSSDGFHVFSGALTEYSMHEEPDDDVKQTRTAVFGGEATGTGV